MGFIEDLFFISKDAKARRAKEFQTRVLPHGLEEQRECAKNTLSALLPDMKVTDSMFAFFDAKDNYVKSGKGADGRQAAMARLKRLRWIDESKKKLILAYVELETEIESLDDYPTVEEIRAKAFGE